MSDRTSFNTKPLDEQTLRSICPSIFATTAHPDKSDRFWPIVTWDILRSLSKEGFEPFSARQVVTRTPDRVPFTKHLIRLRHRGIHIKGDTIAEVVLKNANDGTSVYDLMAGLFRVLCLNGMVCQTDQFDTLRVRHTGPDVESKVIEGTFKVIGQARLALEAPSLWGQIQLEKPERLAFAKAAHALRFEPDSAMSLAIHPAMLLGPRRSEDIRSDLWGTFNVVQENLIKGGLQGLGINANGVRRSVTTRDVTSIDRDVKLNKSLWVLGERMAKYKTGVVDMP